MYILLQVISLVSELCNQDATKMLHTLSGKGRKRMGMRLDEPGNQTEERMGMRLDEPGNQTREKSY